jgi:monofunctional biosynthetic peptidoglycan transglycosylase
MAPSAPPSGPDGAPAPDGSSSPSWRRTVRRVVRRTIAGVLSVGATYLGGCFFALLVYSVVFPPVTSVQLQRQIEATVSGADAERAYTPVPLSQMDSALPLAVVAGEDSRFFLHWGIDWKEIGKAIENYRQGDELRGASSITQQLVKNLFLTTHSTLLRKGLEVPLTYGAELLLSKRRILELYINVIEWGPGVYGAEAATQYHYGTSAEHLTRYQAAALAACIPNPLQRRPETAGWYARIILQRMAQIGRLPLSQVPGANARFVATQPRPSPSSPSRVFSGPA